MKKTFPKGKDTTDPGIHNLDLIECLNSILPLFKLQFHLLNNCQKKETSFSLWWQVWTLERKRMMWRREAMQMVEAHYSRSSVTSNVLLTPFSHPSQTGPAPETGLFSSVWETKLRFIPIFINYRRFICVRKMGIWVKRRKHSWCFLQGVWKHVSHIIRYFEYRQRHFIELIWSKSRLDKVNNENSAFISRPMMFWTEITKHCDMLFLYFR